MKTISIRQAVREGWTQFLKRPGYLFVLSVSVFGLFIMASAQNAAYTALGAILYAGYLTLLLRHMRGQPFSFDDLFVVDNRWIYFAFLLMIKGFFILLGLVLFVVPGVYLALKWSFAELLVIDKGMRPMEALRASSEMTQGIRFKLLLFTVVAILITFVGLLALVVGVIVSGTVVALAGIHLYTQAQQSSNEQA